MIFKSSENCAKVLFDMKPTSAEIEQTKAVFDFEGTPKVADILSSPIIKADEKKSIIEKLFPKSLQGFLNVMCETGNISQIKDVFEAYDNLILKEKNWVKATLYYVNRPDEETIKSFKDMLCKKYNASGCEFVLIEDASLMGGYKLLVGDVEFDKSISGTIKALRNKLTWR